LNPPKGEGVQVSPIWEGLETLRFQVPFPKTSNQTHGKGTSSIPFLHTKHSPRFGFRRGGRVGERIEVGFWQGRQHGLLKGQRKKCIGK